MICPKCGKVLPDAAAFCTGCGNRMEQWPAAEESTPASAPVAHAVDFVARIKELLGSGLFLAIAILSTINAVYYMGTNILSILTAIAMWVIYAAAKSDKYTCQAGLKFSSGIIKAKYIINWVLVGILSVVLAILIIVVPMVKGIIEEAEDEFNRSMEKVLESIPKDFDINEGLDKELDKALDELYGEEEFVEILEKIEKHTKLKLDRDSVEDMIDKIDDDSIEDGFEWMSDHKSNMLSIILDTVTTMVIVVYAVALVMLILINILVVGRLKKFARSAWEAVEANDKCVLNLTLLRSALVTMGIFSLVTPFAAAACFVGVALVGKMRRELI